MRKRMLWFAPLALVGFAAFIALGGAIVLWLWNWLLPPLFGWHEITFWQALGILLLCRILFGRFGMRGGPRSGMRGRMRDRMADHVADRVAGRWQAMTPEERERFRQRMRERWGLDVSAGAAAGPSTSESKGE